MQNDLEIPHQVHNGFNTSIRTRCSPQLQFQDEAPLMRAIYGNLLSWDFKLGELIFCPQFWHIFEGAPQLINAPTGFLQTDAQIHASDEKCQNPGAHPSIVALRLQKKIRRHTVTPQKKIAGSSIMLMGSFLWRDDSDLGLILPLRKDMSPKKFMSVAFVS